MTMKVSDLKFTKKMRENAWLGHRVEMPKTDAQRYVSSIDAVRKFIAEFGDVEIVFNNEYAPCWEVPAFKTERDEYGKLKQAYCDMHGSN